jgi:putative restriction endonuclease
MNPDTLAKYLEKFRSLSRKHSKEHGLAPHKPILLLALLDEIARGAYHPQGLILPTPELVAAFRAYWQNLGPFPGWQPRMDNPFRYLYRDGFWSFLAGGVPVVPEDRPYTLHQISRDFDGVRLASDLSLLLADPVAVHALRQQLLDACFHKTDADLPRTAVTDILNDEVEKLKSEAQSKFRVRKVREGSDDGYFVRHALFPRVIKSLYNDQCCVCGLGARLEGGKAGSNIVDGAHILPFAEFHSDDPRNGLALCKNHHWGFDSGWFAITESYKVAVSPQLKNAAGYIEPGTELILPEDALYHPDPAALQWHWDNTFLTEIINARI